jgi:hypothetical protein
MGNNTAVPRAVFFLALIFVLGVCIGSLGTYYWAVQRFPPRPYGRDAIVKELTKDLSLAPGQQDQLRAVLDDTGAKMRALNQQVVIPQQDAIIHEARDRIRAILTPEQKPKYEEFVRKMDERWKKRRAH